MKKIASYLLISATLVCAATVYAAPVQDCVPLQNVLNKLDKKQLNTYSDLYSKYQMNENNLSAKQALVRFLESHSGGKPVCPL